MSRVTKPAYASRPVEYRRIEVVLSKIDDELLKGGKLGWHLVAVSPTDKTLPQYASPSERLYLLVFKR